MSKHVITLTVELDDTNPGELTRTVKAIAEGAVRNAIEDYEASASEDGRSDGYDGPFLLTIDASIDGQEVSL